MTKLARIFLKRTADALKEIIALRRGKIEYVDHVGDILRVVFEVPPTKQEEGKRWVNKLFKADNEYLTLHHHPLYTAADFLRIDSLGNSGFTPYEEKYQAWIEKEGIRGF